jgi:hypothetical protein
MRSFKTRIEEERTQRALQEHMAYTEKMEKEAMLAKKREKAEVRNKIADKYGLQRR